MSSKRWRIDRFISQHTGISRGNLRLAFAQRRVRVNADVCLDTQRVIGAFDRLEFLPDSAADVAAQYGEHSWQLLQQQTRQYWMMHKAVGVVSATFDDEHRTVLDDLAAYCGGKLSQAELDSLHIVGRLDRQTSGLLLLTNDGDWSRRIMSPEHKVKKTYQVQLEKPLSEEYVQAFAAGMYFEFENITTAPVALTIIDDYHAQVVLTEGRYHQIKRMFGRFRNPVLGLHRSQIGGLSLHGSGLKPGEAVAIDPLAIFPSASCSL